MSSPATPKVMLLVDADNVSADVIEQAVRGVLAEHGALHVRRAYCTPEMALKHQLLFKRLAMRPMVNLAAGKNSTDIALAVDALDLVIAERPQWVYLVSSDSDFAPLVSRLREKGCRVCGIGQQGKTGEETRAVYDHFIDLKHKGAVTATSSPAPAPVARKSAAKAPARKSLNKQAAPAVNVGASAAAADADSAGSTPAVRATRSTAKAAAPAVRAAAAPKPASAPTPAPARKTAARKTRTASARVGASDSAGRTSGASGAPAPAPTPSKPAVSAAAQAILDAAPALRRGTEVSLNDVVKALRAAQLLGKNASSLKFFEKLAGEFVLLQHPDRVRWSGA